MLTFLKDWLPNRKSAITIKDFKSAKDVANYVRSLNENDTLYNEYMEHKLTGKITNLNLLNYFKTGHYGTNTNHDNTVEAFECYVCDNHTKRKLIDKNIYNCLEPEVNNSWYYHWKMGKCQAKILNRLINQFGVSNITKETNEKLMMEYVLQNTNCNS